MPETLVLFEREWVVDDFDPDTLAPQDYSDLDPELLLHSCDGSRETPAGLRAASAATRGWGTGWPNCQYDKWVTITRDDGLKVSCNTGIATLAALLIDETQRRGYDLVPGWCWGAACRSIRGSSSPSNHSWGLAFDFNAPNNPMGNFHPPRTDMPAWMPRLWWDYQFYWGGWYSSRTDAMHYEFMGSPDDARSLTLKAFASFGGQEEDDMTPEQARQLQWAYDSTRVSLPGSDTAIGLDKYVKDRFDAQDKRFDTIDRALATLQTGGLDVDAVAKRVIELMGEQLSGG